MNMKKKLSLIFMLIILVIFAAACGKDSDTASNDTNSGDNNDAKTEETQEITITHQLGETTVKKNPEKVVVFDFGILDSLDKLGIDVVGLPKQGIPAYLSKYEDDKYENVGSLKEADFEKIAEIAPDLIIISGRQQEMYEEFTKIAPTIFMGVDMANYLDSFKNNMKTLGEIFGKEDEIEKEVAAIEESIAQLKEKAANAGTSLFVLANEGNLSAFGSGSRYGFVHDVFGLVPVDENIEASTHGQNISLEYLVEKDPDYLFVIDRGAAIGGEESAKKTIETDLTKNTKAVKNGNIVYLDPNVWYLSGGGLVSVSEQINEIASAFE